MHRLILAVVFAVSLIIAACGDDDASPVAVGDGVGTDGAPSMDGDYRGVSVTEAGSDRPLVAGTDLAIRFDGASFSANAGCNTLGGTFRVEGATFVADAVSQTEMGCEADRMAQDAWLAEFLTARPTLRFDPAAADGTAPLVLTRATSERAPETTISFVTKDTVEPDVDLVGTVWLVTGVIEGDAVSSPAVRDDREDDRDRRPRIVFDENGLMTGHDGCNGFGYGSAEGESPEGLAYEVAGDPTAEDGATITFSGHPASTLMACSGMDPERFFAPLTGVVAAEIDGSSLTLTAADGRGITYRSA